MKVGQKIFDGANSHYLTASCRSHGFNGFAVRRKRIEGQSAIGYGAKEHHAEGLGKTQTCRRPDFRGILFKVCIDTCAHDRNCGHFYLLGTSVALWCGSGTEDL